MKILWIYAYDPHYDMDDWFHLKFAKAISEYPNVELFLYGYQCHLKNPELVNLLWDKNITMKDIKCIYGNIDVIILNTKSRMFKYYNPFTKIAKDCFLPKDFNSCKIPKIVIEEDYHWEKNDNWYKEVGVDLILQRHKSQVTRPKQVKSLWFPFSVDTNIFKPNTNIIRQNKICYSGSLTSPYIDRKEACEKLKQFELIDIFGSREKINNDYITCLQSYVSHLSGATTVDITAAKNFEIMSSGSVLLTNYFTGIEDLFDNNSYVLFNKDNIVDKAMRILNNSDYRKEIASNGINCILKNHTNEIRIKQLIDIIKKEL